MAAAEQVAAAHRILAVGIGGGGDVVGALVAAEAARALGTGAVVGGLTWERRPVDPLPGPRTLAEVGGAQPLNAAVALAGPATTGPGGFRFCEAAMSDYLGEPVALVDPNPGPRVVGESLGDAARRLDCDLVVLLDVGGDVLAHGDEPGLASPLADAVLLAAAPHVGLPVLGIVFGAGCDGELTPAEVVERIGELPRSEDLPHGDLARAEGALATVVTEASEMALRCARGETGEREIRQGRRTVRLTPDGGRLVCFDPAEALAGPARCAAAVADAGSLIEAHELLTGRGIRTELAYEREMAGR